LSHYLKAKSFFCFGLGVLLLVEHITECISTLLFFIETGCFLYYLVLVLIFLLQKKKDYQMRLLSSNGVSGDGGGVVAVGNVG